MFRLAFYPVFGSYLLVAALLGLILAAALLFPPNGRRLPRNGGKFIFGLRSFALLLLIASLLRATVVYTETRDLSATVVLLLDCSESMAVPDEAGGKSRFETARQSLEEAAPAIERLSQRCEVKAYAFDAEATPLEIKDGFLTLASGPKGAETAIGYNLEQVQTASSGKRIIATVLLSDGTQRAVPPRDIPPQDAATRYRDSDSPLYGVQFGKPGTAETQDISVRELFANERVFVKNEFEISGQIRISGYVNQMVPVVFAFETEPGVMTEIARKDISVSENGQLVPYEFKYIPQTPGLRKLSVSVPPQPKELITANNSISTFIRVLDGGLKVLYFEGTRRFEHAYIIRALDASPDIQVDYETIDTDMILQESTGAKPANELLIEKTRKRDPLDEKFFKPGEYMVYIIGDIDSDAFKKEELQSLRDLVERQGAGIMFLGGLHTYGPGGYGTTPLEPIFPVPVPPIERLPFGSRVSDDVHIKGPFKIMPTEIARSNYLLRFSPDKAANDAIWNALPELPGANRLGNPKSGAIKLLQGSRGETILVSQIFGKGRVLASALDSTYRWWLAGHESEHKRFWRQVVLWLAKMDDSLSGDCWISLEKNRYDSGETAKFRVFLKDSNGEQVKSPDVHASVVFPDGREEEVPLADEDGTMTGSFRKTRAVGDYTIRATAVLDETKTPKIPPDAPTTQQKPPEGPQMKNATAKFTVLERNIELENPIADARALDNLAAMTGGKTVAPEQLASLLDEIGKKSTNLTETRETKRTLYDSWWLLAGFVSLMACEWYLRKRWGLV